MANKRTAYIVRAGDMIVGVALTRESAIGQIVHAYVSGLSTDLTTISTTLEVKKLTRGEIDTIISSCNKFKLSMESYYASLDNQKEIDAISESEKIIPFPRP